MNSVGWARLSLLFGFFLYADGERLKAQANILEMLLQIVSLAKVNIHAAFIHLTI